jgi:hypothetical protein
MRKSLAVLAAALAFSIVGCGGDDDPPVIAISCNFEAQSECDTATATEATLRDAGLTRASCEAEGGTWVSSCTAVGRIGRCSGTIDGVRFVLHYYPPHDASIEEPICVGSGGTWEAN